MRHIAALIIFSLGFSFLSYAHIGPHEKKKSKTSYRFDCAPSTAEVDMAINNVRVRLQVGGDLFWNFDEGRYIVPKRDPASGIPEVSSIFAGAVWMGGVTPGPNPSLKIACQDYRVSNGVDYYPGPLSDVDGTTNAQQCRNWDQFFRVSGASIRQHLENVEFYSSLGQPYPPSEIPEELKRWPAIGNPFFRDYNNFDLPDAQQGLGNFWDSDVFGERDGLYDPSQGDYPIIEIRGCFEPTFADDMYFWIFNDAGNVHEVTEGTPMRMEVQVQAYAYKTLDEINNMTFYRYKLINRAAERIDSAFFAMWMDPDLGCPDDDFVGCDPASSLMYVYNQDNVDGNNGSNCTSFGQIIPSYGDEVPILGVDIFRGPISEPRLQPDGTYQRVELGMSSFTAYNRGNVSNPPVGTQGPTVPIEYYRMLNGYWRDGIPLTYGGDGYLSGGPQVKYAFSDTPEDDLGWSMCTADLPLDDRRTIQSCGPFRLDPGSINELVIGVVWLPEADYPCPSIEPLLRADQRAQNLFFNCFGLESDGPDAPTIVPIGLDQEIIVSLVNEAGSNNFGLGYEAPVPAIAGLGIQDSNYIFEGYRVYQLADANVIISNDNLNDVVKAREIYQFDVINGVGKIFNWNPFEHPLTNEIFWTPTEMVDGQDQGLLQSFTVTEDAFGPSANNELINDQEYYFTVIAYAHNNFDDFDPDNPTLGQRTSYIVGRNNVKKYKVVPRELTTVKLNSFYGEGLKVTRLDGDGVINNSLIISEETRVKILEQNGLDALTWEGGGSPINAKVYDPLRIKDGTYLLSFDDFDGDPELKETKFKVEHVQTGEIHESESTIDVLNEELIRKYGFSVYFNQGVEPGTQGYADPTNGFLGSSVSYVDDNGAKWFDYIQEGSSPRVDFIKTDDLGASDFLLDPYQVYNTQNHTGFYPFLLMAFDTTGDYVDPQMLLYSPGWFDGRASQLRRRIDGLSNLNNVDIVFTSDKTKWSKCIVVQAANYAYTDEINEDERSMDLLQRPSVTKESDPNNDNLPAEANDGTVGYAYFPGYAVDVETGRRLNIFFGENTYFSPDGIGQQNPNIPDEMLTGNDRMWNPNDLVDNGMIDELLTGGQHYIYVTDLPYDGCEMLHDSLVFAATRPTVFANIIKTNLFKFISWAGYPIMKRNESLLSYRDGLIPNDLTISMRVKNSFRRQTYTGGNDGFNQYRIKVDGKESVPVPTNVINTVVDSIELVVDPFHNNTSTSKNGVNASDKELHVPQNYSVSIYSIDGKLIHRFGEYFSWQQNLHSSDYGFEAHFVKAVEWDLKNKSRELIGDGIYLIHAKSDTEEHVVKWLKSGSFN